MLALKVTSAGDWASGLADDEFAAAFGIRGKPGWAPSRLASRPAAVRQQPRPTGPRGSA